MALKSAIERHYEIISLLETEKDQQKIKQLCIEDISLLPAFKEETKKQGDKAAKEAMEFDKKLGLKIEPFSYYQALRSQCYCIPRFPSFKTLAIIYEKEKDYDNAIKICQLAIDEGQGNDRTKGGMNGRIEKLKKKQEKE